MAKGSQGGISNNPKGKPVGTKSAKTKQWESLAEKFCGEYADEVVEYLDGLVSDNEFTLKNKQGVPVAIDGKELFFQHYKDLLNYFKPKINHNINEETSPVNEITFTVKK